MVFKLEFVGAEPERRRKIASGDTGGLVAHEVVAREIQQLWIFPLSLFSPLLEVGAVVQPRWHTAVVERENQLVVDQNVRPPRLVLKLFDVVDQLLVVRKERRSCVEFAFNERRTDENFA